MQGFDPEITGHVLNLFFEWADLMMGRLESCPRPFPEFPLAFSSTLFARYAVLGIKGSIPYDRLESLSMRDLH
jgi:hypothetical protein